MPIAIDHLAMDPTDTRVPETTLERIVQEAARLLGSPEKAARWLVAYNPVMGESPAAAMARGASNLVEDELVRIDYGDFT